MDFSEFKNNVNISRHDICLEILKTFSKAIRIKKEKTLEKNLADIFDAALKISNDKGFQAMSMRDLSRETGLSMGALYAYFSSKEELLEMLQQFGISITRQVLEEHLVGLKDPAIMLHRAIETHLFLSEVLHPWFFFSYMEAKNLPSMRRDMAKRSELETEKIFSDIIAAGIEAGIYVERDSKLSAAVLKAMLQDWYLKRWKYAKRGISIDDYAEFVIDFMESFLAPGRRDLVREG